MVPIDSRDLEALSADWLMLKFLFVNRNTAFPCKPRVCIGTPYLVCRYKHGVCKEMRGFDSQTGSSALANQRLELLDRGYQLEPSHG